MYLGQLHFVTESLVSGHEAPRGDVAEQIHICLSALLLRHTHRQRLATSKGFMTGGETRASVGISSDPEFPSEDISCL